MTIARRLAVSYGVLLTFLVVVLSVAVSQLDHLIESNRDLVSGDLKRAELANRIHVGAESAAGRLALLFVLDDRDHRVSLYREIDQHNAAIDQAIEQLQALVVAGSGSEALARVTSLRAAFQQEFDGTVESLEGGDRSDAGTRMAGRTREALSALLSATAAMAASQHEAMLQRQSEAADSAFSAKILVFALGLGALLAGVAMAILITRGIARPLAKAVEVATRITDGDLQVPAPLGGKDEVGQLLSAMERMRQHLREVIGTIHASSGQVSQSAETLGEPAARVKSGSAEQRVLATDIEQSVRQLSTGIQDMASDVQSTREEALKARDLAQHGARAIVTAADEIGRIANAVSESARSVERLDESARKVAGTVGIIKEIADQTNLLALNASIEAARAGESGRGFAVVADEVRKLATRTAEATHEIDQVIRAIQQDTEITTRDIDAGRTGMDHGMVLIRDIVAPLGELRDGAQTSLDSLERLSRVADEQARESLAIANNVQEISAMAGSNSEAAENVASITTRLRGLATQLRTSVGAFRT